MKTVKTELNLKVNLACIIAITDGTSVIYSSTDTLILAVIRRPATKRNFHVEMSKGLIKALVGRRHFFIFAELIALILCFVDPLFPPYDYIFQPY